MTRFKVVVIGVALACLSGVSSVAEVASVNTHDTENANRTDADETTALLLPFVAQVNTVRNTPTGFVGGQVTAVAAHGAFAYVGLAHRLSTYDVSDPTRPRHLGSAGPFLAEIYDMTVADGFLYTVHERDKSRLPFGYDDDEAGLGVFSLTDPAGPRLLGHVATPEQAHRVVVQGEHAYIADYQYGLRIVDVSDPTAPTLIGALQEGVTEDLVVRGRYAWLAISSDCLDRVCSASPRRLVTVDISNPGAPAKVHTLVMPDNVAPYALEVSGDVVFVGGTDGLHVMDGSDATDPVEVLDIEMPWVTHLTADGDRMYALARGYAGSSATEYRLVVLDIGEPADPSVLGSVAVPGVVDRLAVAGHVVLAKSGPDDVAVVDVSNGREPRLLTRQAVDSLHSLMQLTVTGDDVALAVSQRGFELYDVSRPETARTPRRLASIGLTGTYRHRVAASDLHAYVADVDFPGRPSRLLVFDIEDRTSPHPVAEIPLPGTTKRIVLEDDTLFVVEWYGGGSDQVPEDGGVRVIDVTRPDEPRQIGVIDVSAYDLAIRDGYGYVTNRCDGRSRCLDVYDLTDPADPRRVSSLSGLRTPPEGLVVADDHLVAAGRLELTVFDLVDPAAPRVVGSAPLRWTGGPGDSVPVSFSAVAGGSEVYVPTGDTVQVFDISDPARPVERSRLAVTYPSAAFARGTTLYIGTANGIWVYDRAKVR